MNNNLTSAERDIADNSSTHPGNHQQDSNNVSASLNPAAAEFWPSGAEVAARPSAPVTAQPSSRRTNKVNQTSQREAQDGQVAQDQRTVTHHRRGHSGQRGENSALHGNIGGSTRSNAPRAYVNANHLLNFQYESRTGRGGAASRGGRYGHSDPPHRRRTAPAPRYDKNKFLQANFRFLVSDAVDVSKFLADPDRMFDWDDVIQVEMLAQADNPVQCSISLDSPPLCPQITPCGHVFSFPSIMQHLMHHGGDQLRWGPQPAAAWRAAPCPLCYTPIVARELRLVEIRYVEAPKVGGKVEFQLLRRLKTSIIPEPLGTAADPGSPEQLMNGSKAQAAKSLPGAPAGSISPLSTTPFAKFLTMGNGEHLWRAAVTMLAEYAAQVMQEGGMEAAIEAPSLYAAMESLAKRAGAWTQRRAELLEANALGVASPDAQRASAEAAVRRVFTAAVDEAQHSREVAAAEAARAAEFPSLAVNTSTQTGSAGARNGSTAAAAAVPSRPAAPPPFLPASQPVTSQPAISQPSTSQPPASPQAAPDTPAAQDAEEDGGGLGGEFTFEPAFSEDEGEEPENFRGGDAAEESEPTPPTPAPMPSCSPGTSLTDTSDVLGTSPNTNRLNTMSAAGEYYTYQSADGQWLFLHPIDLKVLLTHYGSYLSCPPRIEGVLLELEDMVQGEASRKRWRFLSHLPLTGNFKFAELDLTNIVPPEALAPFAEEVAQRDKRRKRREEAEKRQEAQDAAAARLKERLGPNAAELRAMPTLPKTQLSDTGLTEAELAESLALQASFDDAPIVAASPPAAGVSFAKMTKMGYAASGPTLAEAVAPAAAAGGSAVVQQQQQAVPPSPAASLGAWAKKPSATWAKPAQGGAPAASATTSGGGGSSPAPASAWGPRTPTASAAAGSSALQPGPDADGGSASKKGKKGMVLLTTVQRRY